MPTISLDPWQWRVAENEPDHVPEDAIRIDLSRVLKPGEMPTDPRDNRQVRAALDRAGKLVEFRAHE